MFTFPIGVGTIATPPVPAFNTWVDLAPATTPSARFAACMAWDISRGYAIMFGGTTNGSTGNSETWKWDGSNWTQLTPSTTPGARFGHAMAYDVARQKICMIGGYSGGYVSCANWYEWSGTDWVAVAAAGSTPVTFVWGSACYEPTTSKIIMVAGQSSDSSASRVWSWDGSASADIRPASNRFTDGYDACVSYDAVRGKTLRVGGSGAPSQTWERNTATNEWTLPTIVPALSRGFGHGQVYDTDRLMTILVGGTDGSNNPDDETFSWDGVAGWDQRTPVAKFTTRNKPVTCYDPVNKRTVVYGGKWLSGNRSDTWGSAA